MNKRIYKFLLILFGLLMILSLISIFYWFYENKSTNKIVKKEEKHLKKEEEVYTLNKNILKDNKYTIGWLIVKGTNINYPVVKYKDNDFYLNHDFYNNYNSAGWIFMDYRNNLEDQNIVIYGHHRHDNTMFGDIDKLFNQDFYKNNNEILFITNNKVIRYKIFSVYSINSNDKYINNNFENFNKTINKFKNRSKIKINEEMNNTNQIITLSTCHSNNLDRLVVHGYKKN